MKFVYIACFFFLWTISRLIPTDIFLAPVFDLMHIPTGYRTFSAAVVLLPFLAIIILNRKQQIWPDLWSIAKYWIPWILYLAIRTNLSEIGIFKFGQYMALVFFPCIIIIVMYKANEGLFEKTFLVTFLSMSMLIFFYNFILGHALAYHPSQEQWLLRRIGLSRAFGISFVCLVITAEWKKRPALVVPLLVVLASFMVMLNQRGPVVFAVITVAFYLVVKHRRDVLRLFWICWGGVLIILAVAFMAFLSQSFESFLTHGHKMKLADAAKSRVSVYEPTAKIITSDLKSVIIGVGFGNWGKEYISNFMPKHHALAVKMRTEKRFYIYPHNIFLEIMAELGLIGLILFIFLFYPFKRLFNLNDKYNMLVLLSLLFALVSHDLPQNQVLMIFNVLSIISFKSVPTSVRCD